MRRWAMALTTTLCLFAQGCGNCLDCDNECGSPVGDGPHDHDSLTQAFVAVSPADELVIRLEGRATGLCYAQDVAALVWTESGLSVVEEVAGPFDSEVITIDSDGDRSWAEAGVVLSIERVSDTESKYSFEHVGGVDTASCTFADGAIDCVL